MSDWNTGIIDEFRRTGGQLGGNFEGAPMLLLHTKGAKTGKERVNPLVYRRDGERYVVFASKAGAPTNPDWYHNLVAHPDVTVEIGSETIALHAHVVEGDERDRLFDAQKHDMPGFADYERKTAREIPVVILTPL